MSRQIPTENEQENEESDQETEGPTDPQTSTKMTMTAANLHLQKV